MDWLHLLVRICFYSVPLIIVFIYFYKDLKVWFLWNYIGMWDRYGTELHVGDYAIFTLSTHEADAFLYRVEKGSRMTLHVPVRFYREAQFGDIHIEVHSRHLKKISDDEAMIRMLEL